MKINSKDFRVQEGEKVKLKKWPTLVKPVYQSKEQYQDLIGEGAYEGRRTVDIRAERPGSSREPPHRRQRK